MKAYWQGNFEEAVVFLRIKVMIRLNEMSIMKLAIT